jgi:hypothetical protein
MVSCLVGALSPYLDRTYYLSEIVPLPQLIILDISSYVCLLCQYNIVKHWIDSLNSDESMMPMNNLLILLSNNVNEEIILPNIVPLTYRGGKLLKSSIMRNM